MPQKYSSIAVSVFVFLILAAIGAGGYAAAALLKKSPAVEGLPVVIPGGTAAPVPRPVLASAGFFEDAKQRLIAEGALFIEADLSEMKVRVYEAGSVIKEADILTKGREGSWWETPVGLYKVETKERNHFSSFGKVYQPWSMAFQGNFFIHGWPYYPGGEPVASEFSGGCIRLSSEDAKAIYDLISVGTPVLVLEDGFRADTFTYAPSPASPEVEGRAYLAADLRNNFVFAERGKASVVPIASIAKLMTALIAAEYINLDNSIYVPASAIVPTSYPRLKAGERRSAYQLLYPLLMESSNEAAMTYGAYLGQERFVGLMNKKAAALGMTNTRFMDPAGRGEGNISTAEDLFLLAKYIHNNRSFIFKITSDTLGWNVYGPAEFKDLKNFNHFAGVTGFVGGKVGYTEAARRTMIAVFETELMDQAGAGETRPVVYITLGGEHNKEDVESLRAFVDANY